MRSTSTRLVHPEYRALVARSLLLEQRTSGNALGPPSLFCIGIALELGLGDETVLIDLETVSVESNRSRDENKSAEASIFELSSASVIKASKSGFELGTRSSPELVQE